MATTTQPTIIWKQYKIGTDDKLTAGQTLNGNTVDYQAVQAGQYSPAICVRPQFSTDDSNSGSIGSVRLWWSTTTASDPSGGNLDLPSYKWVLKYFVSDCDEIIYGDKSTTTSNDQRCVKMLKFLSSSERVTKVATGRTFAASEIANNVTGWAWCKSVWENSNAVSTTTGISMQPVPFSGYKDSIAQHESQYQTKYSGTTWISTVFGMAADATYTSGQLMDYAAGGVLTSTYKCNVKGFVNGNNSSDTISGFPYIFFTIKAPTDAAAGTWSGWACRISYIWPYTASTTTTTN